MSTLKDLKMLNRCFNLTLSEKDLVDLALAGLRSSYKEKLDGSSFYSLNQLQVRALGQEAKFKKEKIPTSPIVQTHILLNMIPFHRTMRINRYILLNSFGPPRPNHILVHLSSQLKGFGKRR